MLLYHKQKGVALIVALIVTMLAVSIATTVLYRQQIHIRLSGNISHLETSLSICRWHGKVFAAQS